MSKKEPLQRRIILHLAQTRPQTINETAKGTSKDYKSSWIAFKKLEKKGLIKNVQKKYYMGNQYPCFWLTEIGILHALYESANPEHLLNQTLKVYPQNKNLQFFIETVPIFGKFIANIFGEDISGNPDEVETHLIKFLSTFLVDPYTQEQITKLKALLKKYPELCQHLLNELEQYAEELKKTVNLLQQERSGE
jgi:hypothetical protein